MFLSGASRADQRELSHVECFLFFIEKRVSNSISPGSAVFKSLIIRVDRSAAESSPWTLTSLCLWKNAVKTHMTHSEINHLTETLSEIYKPGL